MKIAVTTVSFSKNQELLKKLKQTGHQIKVNPYNRRLTQLELIDLLNDCEAAIIGLDIIDATVLGKCPKLKLISKYGVGLDNIDFKACADFNVRVKYPVGINKRSVSEMALAMILGLVRNIYRTSLEIKEGEWNKSGGFQLTGKSVGIIGFGNIGKDLAYLLSGFDVKIFANDIDNKVFKNVPPGITISSKEEIFRKCDIISIHTPLVPETENLINSKSILKLKDGVILINTARGGIINEEDVYDALLSGKIGGLGIDAYRTEPAIEQKFLKLKNVICTPHIGGNSKEAVLAMGTHAINAIIHV
jgi:D-3-phosphoglycerate dehydrogenase